MDYSYSTPKGSKIKLAYADGAITATLPTKPETEVELSSFCVERVKVGGGIQTVLVTEDKKNKYIGCSSDDSGLNDFLVAARATKKSNEEAELEKNIPAAKALTDAQYALSRGLDSDGQRMKEIMNDSFSETKSIDLASLQGKVDALKAKFPKAAFWMKCKGFNGYSDMAFRARKAQQMLESGESLEAAKSEFEG